MIIVSPKNIFVTNGIPQQIFTDSFNSHEYKEFTRKYCTDLKTSSPEFPRFNDMVERHIQIMKDLSTKAVEDVDDPMLAILS